MAGNFLSAGLWAGQGLDHHEIGKVLNQPLPTVDKENADKPLMEVIAKTTNRTVVLIPAQSDEDKRDLPTYGQAMAAIDDDDGRHDLRRIFDDDERSRRTGQRQRDRTP